MEKTERFLQDEFNWREEIQRYISFWPHYMVLLILFISIAFLYLRYTTYNYQTNAIIEIIDESQNNEMALPTELTVFNRSMINLENEINILKSYDLNRLVVEKLNSNIKYYNKGLIKSSLSSKDKFFDDYNLEYMIDLHEIKSKISFSIQVDEENNLTIKEFDKSGDLKLSHTFNNLTTLSKLHNLPFDLTINFDNDILSERNIIMFPIENEVSNTVANLEINTLGRESDQLLLSITHENSYLGEEYLAGLMEAFDNDGIYDRQLEYERTIDFVNERELILKKELEVVELKKQQFKQSNNLTDLSLDAGNNIDLKYTYNGEIFQLNPRSQ